MNRPDSSEWDYPPPRRSILIEGGAHLSRTVKRPRYIRVIEAIEAAAHWYCKWLIVTVFVGAFGVAIVAIASLTAYLLFDILRTIIRGVLGQ